MTRLVTIDPGVRALGVCFFEHRVFRLGLLSRSKARKLTDQIAEHRSNLPDIGATHAAVESMVYRPTDSTPQDLINVQAVGCTLAGMLAPAVTLYPSSEWKGTTPKRIHHERIQSALMFPAETEALADSLKGIPKAHQKEILDALGIGLYHLGRTTRAGTPRRR